MRILPILRTLFQSRPRLLTMALAALAVPGISVQRAAAAGGATSYSYTTFAGVIGYYGSLDGQGTAAAFYFPNAVTVAPNGTVYVADTFNQTIRKITPSGAVTTLAGVPMTFGLADGVGSAARFNGPRGITVDSNGVVYVADTSNHTVRKVLPDGTVSTLAGQAGVKGAADGTGTGATFNMPYGIVADAGGNVYVADFGNDLIRRITPAGVVTTIAGKSGLFHAYEDGTGSSAHFFGPAGLGIDAAGNVYIADSNNHTIRKMTPGGVVTTLAGTAGISGTTDGSGSAARFNFPYGLASDQSGNVYVADTNNHTIRMVTSSGATSTIGGQAGVTGQTDGPTALFYSPTDVALSPSGELFIADANNCAIRRGGASGVPTIDTQPTDLTLAVGTSGILAVGVRTSGVSYQWQKNGAAIPGANSATYTITSASPGDAGTYQVIVTGGTGAVASSNAVVTVISTADVGRLMNLSVRTNAGTGASTLIVGIVVGGNGTTGTKATLIRAVGPRLGDYGVSGFLADPRMEFIDQGGAVLATNDDWAGDAQVTAVGAAVGAFPLGSASSKDAALYNPAVAKAPYSVKILGAGGSTGIALAEIYDATPGASVTATTPRLINVSARTEAGTGSATLIAGFVVGGSTARTVLIRGVGPRLADYGVTGTLADPQLELYRSVNGVSVLVATNDDWGQTSSAAAVANTASQVGAFALTSGSKDAVLLLTLPPGVYSAQVSGVNGTTGVALAEVYEVP